MWRGDEAREADGKREAGGIKGGREGGVVHSGMGAGRACEGARRGAEGGSQFRGLAPRLMGELRTGPRMDGAQSVSLAASRRTPSRRGPYSPPIPHVPCPHRHHVTGSPHPTGGAGDGALHPPRAAPRAGRAVGGARQAGGHGARAQGQPGGGGAAAGGQPGAAAGGGEPRGQAAREGAALQAGGRGGRARGCRVLRRGVVGTVRASRVL